MLTLPNPSSPRTLKPVHLITDRAKRYRARKVIDQEPADRCGYCGAPERRPGKLDREHIDGDESNTNPVNLTWACRPCNAAKGAHFARTGRGIRTKQYNPPRKRTGSKFQQYVTDMRIARGYLEGDQDAAWQRILHDFTKEERSKFTSRMWEYRRKIGATSTGRAVVPF